MPRAVYWDREEYDCTEESRRIAREDTLHLHGETDEEAARLFVLFTRVRAVSTAFNYPEYVSLVGPPVETRYVCVHGPGGLVRDISY